jgi:type-F conjugative transfer system pilin assembly protein TrbC
VILRVFFCLLFVPSSLVALMNQSEMEAWVREAASNVDLDAVTWAEKQNEQVLDLKETEGMSIEAKQHFVAYLQDNKCKGCSSSNEMLEVPDDSSLFVAMSFSVPEETWLSLSKEMEALPALFIVRGIPKNSFREFARKLLQLKEKGMNSSVQIDPDSFQNFSIESVPCFVIREKQQYDKISGNISLSFALREFAESGEVDKAEELWESYQKKGRWHG